MNLIGNLIHRLPPEHHLVRAMFWPAMVPVAMVFGWHTSVFVIFLYSTYANFGADIGAYVAAKARQAADNG